MNFKDIAQAGEEKQVPEFESADNTQPSMTMITRLAHVTGWEDALERFATQEPSEAEIDAADQAYWNAYSEAVRNAPSNRDGQGINTEDGKAAGRAGRRAAILAALAIRLKESRSTPTIPDTPVMVETPAPHQIMIHKYATGVRVNCICGWMDRWSVDDGSAQQSGAAHVARELRKENR